MLQRKDNLYTQIVETIITSLIIVINCKITSLTFYLELEVEVLVRMEWSLLALT